MSSEKGAALKRVKKTRFGSVGENVPSTSPCSDPPLNTSRLPDPSGFATWSRGSVFWVSRCQMSNPFWPGGVAAAGAAITAVSASATRTLR